MLPRQRYLPLLHIPANKTPLRQRYLPFLHILGDRQQGGDDAAGLRVMQR